MVRRPMMLAPGLEQGGGNVVCRLLVGEIGAEGRCEVVVFGGWSLACFDCFVAEFAEFLLGHIGEVEGGGHGASER